MPDETKDLKAFWLACPEFNIRADEPEDKDKDELYIEGYASVETIDRHDSLVLTGSAVEAIQEAMRLFMKNPVVLYMHMQDKPCGVVVEQRIDDLGLWVRVLISKAKGCEDIRTQIRERVLRGFSIGFRIKDAAFEVTNGKEIMVIRALELMEISVVTVPSNRDTLFTVAQRMLDLNNAQKEQTTMTTENKTIAPSDVVTVSKADYERLVTAAAILEVEKKHYQDELKEREERKTLNETLKKQLEEREALITAKLLEVTKAVEELKARPASTITLSAGQLPQNTKMTEATGTAGASNDALRNVMLDIRDRGYAELEAEYIKHEVTKNNRSSFEYAPKDVLGFHMSKRGVALNADNPDHREVLNKLATRTISSTTGIIASSTEEYSPIPMDELRAPLLTMVPQVPQTTKAYTWRQRTAKNAAVFASENFTPTAGDSTYGSKSSNLKLMYVAGQVGDFAEELSAPGNSNVALEIEAANQAMDEKLDWTLINGNDSAETTAFDGLCAYLVSSSSQVTDQGGSALTLDMIEQLIATFKGLVQRSSTDAKKPNVLAADPQMYSKIRLLMLAKFTGNLPTRMIEIQGIKYMALEYDGIPIIELDDIRDWSHTPPTVAASAVAGGTLSDATYYARVSAVTAEGESTACSQVSATTSGSNNTVRLAVTKQTADVYYKVYWGTSTGVHKIIQVTQRVAGAGTQNIDISATPTQYYEVPMDNNEGVILATKIGGKDGFEIGFSALKKFVRLGKTGDFEAFYLKSYVDAKLKNEYAAAKLQAQKS